MRFYFILFIILVFFIMEGCSGNSMSNRSFLALGDSYTIGESVVLEKGWPQQLTKLLKEKSIHVTPKVIAKTGWTTDELEKAIEKENINENFDLVTLLVGVNNQYRGRDAENYRKEFKSLLDQAIVFANNTTSKVIVISIPDWGVTEFAKKQNRNREQIAKEIDIFNQINYEETKNKKCRYIDITGISKKALDEELLTADDGLHPSAEMYTLWVEKIFPVALEILQETTSKK